MSDGNAKKISVLIVDDHTIVREGLRSLLELIDDIQVAGEAGNGKDAVDLVDRLHPDVVLMDLVMPDMNGIQATGQIRALDCGAKVIVLTSFQEDEQIIPAIQAGATSFLLKDVSPEDLLEAIRAAYNGEARLHPSVARRLMDQVTRRQPNPPAAENLTGRELDVVRLVSRGMSNREIAAELVISEKTVKTHISSLLSKLGLEDRTQLAIHAIRNRLVE